MNQTDVQEKVLEALGAVGATKTYEDVLEAVDPIGRAYLPQAMRNLRSSGAIKKVIRRDQSTGNLLHEITRLA